MMCGACNPDKKITSWPHLRPPLQPRHIFVHVHFHRGIGGVLEIAVCMKNLANCLSRRLFVSVNVGLLGLPDVNKDIINTHKRASVWPVRGQTEGVRLDESIKRHIQKTRLQLLLTRQANCFFTKLPNI